MVDWLNKLVVVLLKDCVTDDLAEFQIEYVNDWMLSCFLLPEWVTVWLNDGMSQKKFMHCIETEMPIVYWNCLPQIITLHASP